MSEAWNIYIVKGRTGTLYTGITTDVKRRVYEHNHSSKGSKWAMANRPVKLMWSAQIDNRSNASRIESQIKSLTRKDKLEIIKNGKMKLQKRYLVVTYNGYDWDIDKAITKAAGIRESGVGCGSGGRDVNFLFSTEKQVDCAIKRLKKLKLGCKLRYMKWEVAEDEEALGIEE